ncbi:MAG: hypothetical protein K6G03_07400 [Lachnospiraceae bacterium]|nr:hypothetical protein [Lachnospiraceae bacterium]
MTFAKKLFVGESFRGRSLNIIKKIKKRKLMIDTFLICLAENTEDPLEFFDSNQLVQPYYKSAPLYVCGIAKGMEEAVTVISDIIKASEESGHQTVRSYVEELFK